MLQLFRGKGASVVIKILLGLLILSFSVWGLGDLFSPSSSGQSVAEAGETEITQQEFTFNLRRQKAQLRASGFSDEMLAGINLSEIVVDQLITRAVYEEEARAMEIVATDQIVSRTIRETSAFHDAAGKFDRNRYEFSLNNQGYNPAYFERLVSKEVVANMLLDSISAGIKVSKAEASALYKYQKETRDISYVSISIDDAEVIAAPDDATLAEYYDTNKERFRAPDYRKISYIAIDPDEMAKTIEIDVETLKTTYNQRIEEYEVAEERTVIQMLLTNKDTALKAREAIVGGQSFAEVALTAADQDADAINLGTMTKAGMPDEKLAEAAFNLELNGVSEPVESLFGWYLLSVTEIKAGSVQAFDTVSEDLRKEIAREQAVSEAYDLSNALDDTLAGGATLEEASANLGLEMVMLDGLDRNGMNMDANFVTSIPNPASFLKFAFDTEEGLDSLMQDDGADGFFILRVDSLIATRIKGLDEVKDEAAALWDAEQRREKAKVKADALVASLNEGKQLSSLMAETTLKATGLDREGQATNAAKLPREMVTSLFTLSVGKSTSSFAGNDYVVGQVDSIATPSSNADSKDLEQSISDAALAGISSDLVEQYNMALRDRHSVLVNRGIMNLIANAQ